GSPLSAPATLNTAENLDYQGVNTEVPVSPEAPDGIFHTFHFGADTAIWNAAKHAIVPQSGQILKIRLEGCAKPAPSGPPPLTEVHFQDLSPLPGGGAHVNITSGGFDIPVCGQEASDSTVSTYEPFNLCVTQGDYVAFNDEGGYVENIYRNGVPYEVLAPAHKAVADSFIRNEGTGNGSNLEASDVSAMEGFAANAEKELTMQMELGTGSDARYVCPGGSKDAPPVLPVIHVRPQTDGVNRSRMIEVAIYCRPTEGCPGTATLSGAGGEADRVSFDLPGDTTSRVPVRVSQHLLKLIRQHGGVSATFSAVVNGQTFSQAIEIKIL
ncbi:MAG TPA: hypothetical protein VED41_14295, partial [Solirubrobacteraceae bacterium]|nr:hypothetical protein [Solirubrobacteraceae bacterium]